MKTILKIKYKLALLLIMGFTLSCNDLLEEPLENELIAERTNYTISENMVLMLYGSYAEFYDFQWPIFPLVGVRGDDVNPAGDQFPLQATDEYIYDRNFWIYNSVWESLYTDVIYFQGAMEEIDKYQEAGADATEANQYKAQIRVMQAFDLLQLARLWGDIIIPESSQPSELYNLELTSFNDVMQHISNEMDEVAPLLPNVRPNERSFIPGGITRFTALAIKAMANLEMKNYQAVADATGQIIESNKFTLFPDFYQLFNIPGKLSNSKLLEFQYSDFGTGSGTVERYLWNFFGPSSWTPVLEGANGGWGFWEPTYKYVKFMLERGERERLIGTVIFTPDAIDSLEADPDVAEVPDWISNISPSGDIFDNHPRYDFLSTKFYLPTVQLTEGRTNYGENNNFTVIRYAEILLMHAEALVGGASSTAMSADEAVNEVRIRVGMPPLTGVTLEDVIKEKYAEFATEWGIRFYDLVRHDMTSELDYGGREYQAGEDRFLPYPLAQQDILPRLKEAADNN